MRVVRLAVAIPILIDYVLIFSFSVFLGNISESIGKTEMYVSICYLLGVGT